MEGEGERREDWGVRMAAWKNKKVKQLLLSSA